MLRRFKNARLAAIALAAVSTKATMAIPADKVPDLTVPNPSTDDIRVQLNNLIAAVRGITAKLDNDAGVTDVNYTALWMDNTGTLGANAPTKIKAN
jgi:hypothetical protein